MTDSCIFCRIVAGHIPAKKVYEDEHLLAFHDIHPIAPVHVLLIPKQHYANLEQAQAASEQWAPQLWQRLPDIAKLAGIESGYRVIINNGADAHQEVEHIHFHILGGKKLGFMLRRSE